jgi:hypothetical protein
MAPHHELGSMETRGAAPCAGARLPRIRLAFLSDRAVATVKRNQARTIGMKFDPHSAEMEL